MEGVHFDLRRFSPEDVGHKALAVNLSDLAAAGARPRWFLCALGVPQGRAEADRAAHRAGHGCRLRAGPGCALIGGNVTRASAVVASPSRRSARRAGRSRATERAPGERWSWSGGSDDAAAGLPAATLTQVAVARAAPSRSRSSREGNSVAARFASARPST